MNDVLERLLGNEVTMAATVFNAPSISQGNEIIRSFTPLPLSQLPVRLLNARHHWHPLVLIRGCLLFSGDGRYYRD